MQNPANGGRKVRLVLATLVMLALLAQTTRAQFGLPVFRAAVGRPGRGPPASSLSRPGASSWVPAASQPLRQSRPPSPILLCRTMGACQPANHGTTLASTQRPMQTTTALVTPQARGNAPTTARPPPTTTVA